MAATWKVNLDRKTSSLRQFVKYKWVQDESAASINLQPPPREACMQAEIGQREDS